MDPVARLPTKYPILNDAMRLFLPNSRRAGWPKSLDGARAPPVQHKTPATAIARSGVIDTPQPEALNDEDGAIHHALREHLP
ncbi:hypothetical protein GCM10009712_25610 [Pseudarthrobacter sulfonivorans]